MRPTQDTAGLIEDLLDPLTLPLNGTTFGYVTHADLLSWFLSVVARPPTADATEENYYYPLLYLYTTRTLELILDSSRLPSATVITWLGTQASHSTSILGRWQLR